MNRSAADGCRELERLARAHRLVDDAAAVVAEGHERPVLVVAPSLEQVRREGIVALYENLRFQLETASVHLPVAQRPRRIVVARRRLPRLSDGEPDRTLLRRELNGLPGHVWPPSPADGAAIAPRTEQVLGQALRASGYEGALSGALDLELDLGLDSLDRLALLLAAAEASGRPADEEETRALRTVGELERWLRARGGPRGDALLADPSTLTGPRPVDRRRRWLLRPAGLVFLPLLALRPPVRAWLRRRTGLAGAGPIPVQERGRPLMLVSNHQTHLDALLIALCLPARLHRRLFFLGYSGYFAEGWGALGARMFHIIPLSANDRVRDGLSLSCTALERGKVLCIFPEAERTWDGSLQRFRRGAAWIARQSQAHAVPVAVTGAYRCWPRGQRLRWRHGVRISFGTPLPPPAATAGAGELAEYLEGLRDSIGRLMTEAGADPRRGDPSTFAGERAD